MAISELREWKGLNHFRETNILDGAVFLGQDEDVEVGVGAASSLFCFDCVVLDEVLADDRHRHGKRCFRFKLINSISPGVLGF